MAKKPAMGRGLEAIFDSNSAETSSGVSVIRISDIEANKSQPRRTFNDASLAELSQSIAAHGVIQPIAVRSSGDGFYKIIAGERRYRAAKMAGLSEIPAIIMELDERSSAEVAIIENIQREDLNVIEEAAAYKALIDEYKMTQEELSQRIGRSRSSIANVLRVLELPEELQAFLKDEKLSLGHAKALMGLKFRSDLVPTAEKVIALSLNVRATETLVRKINASYTQPETPDANSLSYNQALIKHIFDISGRRVHIGTGKKKTVEISYEDNDDLEALLKTVFGENTFNF